MRFRDNLNSAIFSLTVNKSRALLTALGIIIGISAVILVVSIGKGSENIILREVQALGSKTIIIKAGKEGKGLTAISSASTYLTKTLKYDDLKALNQLTFVSKSAPVIFSDGEVVYKNKKIKTTLVGTTKEGAEIFNLPLKNGRYSNNAEIVANERVVVLGFTLAENLFQNTEFTGQNVKIANQTFKVIGIFLPKGSIGFMDIDNAAYIPYTTLQKLILGIDYFQQINLEVSDEKQIPQTIERIKYILRKQHKITNPDNDDFYIISQEDALRRVNVIGTTFTTFLISIAIISLIVGGIGIMNIMLVAVQERIHEIGLRKAIGASQKDILNQFLSESVILTSLGGILGTILGIFFSWLVSMALGNYLGYNWPLIIPLWVIIISFLVSVIIGIAFGYYPAKKAAKLDPITALRYE